MPDMSSLLMDFSAALPNLAALQWRETWGDQRTRHISPDFTAKMAAESPAGLRLLQAEQCSFSSIRALPASLQVLSLWNDLKAYKHLRERLDLLLAPCASLHEL